jgi:hypothetical protein
MARPSSFGRSNQPVIADPTGLAFSCPQKRAKRLMEKANPLENPWSIDPHLGEGWRAAKSAAGTSPAPVFSSVSYQQHGPPTWRARCRTTGHGRV